MRKAPRVRLILDYKIHFGINPPQNRISLIKFISKDSLLYEFAALNYRLKPKFKIYIDNSVETQIRELTYFTQKPELFKEYFSVFSKHIKGKKDYPIIFNRQACLFAIEEILNSNEMQNIENFSMARIEVWDAILKYLLAINFEITQIKEENDDTNSSFEYLNPKLIPLNELTIETDQIITAFRGYCLIDYFLKRPEFQNEIIIYFKDSYNIEPLDFIQRLLHLYFTKRDEISDLEFRYVAESGHESFFNCLSKRFHNQETHKLISIRKSPFIYVEKNEYIIADISFLIEKAYSQFLNDFWFDRIKHIVNEDGKQKFSFKIYRGIFGSFFEEYLSKILRRCFENYKYSKLLLFDELKIKTKKGVIEIADIYFRFGNKILIGEVKSGTIYDNEKYGGSTEHLYKNDRNKFFEDFGVDQVVKSLSNMEKYIITLDSKFPQGHSYTVFPCLIVNDKSFQTPLMPDTFNTRFQELLKTSNRKVKVNPLTVIHISDLERIEELLNNKPKEIWEILKYHYRDSLYTPPFYNSVNHRWQKGSYPTRVIELLSSYRPKSDSTH